MANRQLDALDRQIVGILLTNGRSTNREIARRVGASEGTIRNRIDKLLRDDVLRIVGVPNPSKIGLPTTAFIGLQVDLSHLEEVARRLADVREMSFVTYTTGNMDIVCLGHFPSNDALLEFLTNTLASIPGIKKVETSITLKTIKQLLGPARDDAKRQEAGARAS